MGNWAGYRSPEFGVYPVELHFSLDSHVGPGWVVPALFNRSGWLAVAEVEMETEFDQTRAVIAACINDEGEVLGQWVAEALFSMQCSLPEEVVVEPPDDLADALDALYWDFLGRCDLSHLRALEDKERQISSSIARLELRRREVYEKVETFLSGLYARRRREVDRPDLRRLIDAKIAEIDSKQAEAEAWHRQQLQAFHSEMETFDKQVLASLQNHGSLRPLYTVYWQTRHSKIRTLANTGFELRFGLPKPGFSESDIAAIELDAKLHCMMVRGRKQQEFINYYTALEKTMEDAQSQEISLRLIGQSLADMPRPAGRTESRGQIAKAASLLKLAEKSRDWERRRNPKPDVRRQVSIAATPKTIAEAAEETALSEALWAALQEDAIREAEPLTVTNTQDMISTSASEQRNQTKSDASMQGSCSSGSMEAFQADEPDISTCANAEPDRAGFETTKAEDIVETQVTPLPAEMLSDSPVPTAQRPGCVCPGDRVLLHFVDPPGPRVQYFLSGLENNPQRGVVGLHDERAVVLLGKRVGERVSFLINEKRRVAVIERIFDLAEDGRA